MTATATPKQISYILSLVNQREGTHYASLAEVGDYIGLSWLECTRGISKAKASAIIGQLTAR